MSHQTIASILDGIIDGIIAREGGYVDHPDDRGGPTNYGITQAVAEHTGWLGDMADLPESRAREIYLSRYVFGPNFYELTEISEMIGIEVIDAGVLSGPATATRWLQRLLNALNRGQRDYPDIKTDGHVGDETLAALTAYLSHRKTDGEQILLRGLNHLQGAYMVRISEKREANESFLYGWLKERTA